MYMFNIACEIVNVPCVGTGKYICRRILVYYHFTASVELPALQVLQLQKLEVVAREEMLHLVADLLDSNYPELYMEFKRMVNEAVRLGMRR